MADLGEVNFLDPARTANNASPVQTEESSGLSTASSANQLAPLPFEGRAMRVVPSNDDYDSLIGVNVHAAPINAQNQAVPSRTIRQVIGNVLQPLRSFGNIAGNVALRAARGAATALNLRTPARIAHATEPAVPIDTNHGPISVDAEPCDEGVWLALPAEPSRNNISSNNIPIRNLDTNRYDLENRINEMREAGNEMIQRLTNAIVHAQANRKKRDTSLIERSLPLLRNAITQLNADYDAYQNQNFSDGEMTLEHVHAGIDHLRTLLIQSEVRRRRFEGNIVR